MGVMKVMGIAGDEEITWDPNDKESTEKAKAEFKRLKDEGYEFFEVAETRGKQVKRFSKKAGKLIAAPAAATSEKQKQGGRALAGGPLATRRRGLGTVPEGFASVGSSLR